MECNYYKRPKDCDDGLTFILIPSSLGDDSPRSTVAPSNGRYQDTIVKYEVNGHTYLYAHDGTYNMIWRSSTVTTVNGKTGDVRLNAEDVGALPDVPDTLEPYAKKSDLAGVAFTGEYEDLLNEPQDFSQEDWDLLWSID